MRVERSTPVGTDLVAVGLPSGHVRGVAVDNPSGSWLRITDFGGTDLAIPPYTMGWTSPIWPAAAAVSLRFVDSPSGTPSTQIGTVVTLAVTDEEIPGNPGYASGAQGEQDPLSVRLTTHSTGIIAREGGTLISPMVQLDPDFKIIPRALHVTAVGGGTIALHSQCRVELINGLGQALLPVIVISAWTPMGSVNVPSGAEAGSFVELFAQTVVGGGAASILARLDYYAVRIS